jgi:hypothetical protein
VKNRTRHARVTVGNAKDGGPSIKVEGIEMSSLIGDDIALRWIRDKDQRGHWELGVTFIDPSFSLLTNAAAREGARRAGR